MFTCGEVGAYYLASAARGETVLSELVTTVVEAAAVRARGFIGHQQDWWAPLSSATIEGFHHPDVGWIAGKSERGFTGPDYQPLLAEREFLRSSIDAETTGLEGIVGSTDKVALYQELGTENARYPIPPRSFIARALQQTVAEIEPMVEAVVLDLMVPE